MDINMPVLNGYEATAEIRKLSERVPIIAVTAYAYASDEERIMNSGFDAYVPKPLNASIMRSKIVELLKNGWFSFDRTKRITTEKQGENFHSPPALPK